MENRASADRVKATKVVHNEYVMASVVRVPGSPDWKIICV